MNPKLSNATFTAARGCLIQINSFAADIETKASILCDGVCIIAALDPKDGDQAEALMISPCGQDGTVFGCSDPRLVELSARHQAWLNDENNSPWADTTAAPLPPSEAAMALQQHLINLNPS
jgi:hypothetical protein